jgi:hypothetical protein
VKQESVCQLPPQCILKSRFKRLGIVSACPYTDGKSGYCVMCTQVQCSWDEGDAIAKEVVPGIED